MEVLWIIMTVLGGIWTLLFSNDLRRNGGYVFSAKSLFLVISIATFAVGLANLI